MRAAAAALAAVAVISGGACGSPRITRADAKTFTAAALDDAGLSRVVVHDGVQACRVQGHTGWRTTAATSAGPVSLCVSLTQRRALSIRDPGLSAAQFRRLDRFRDDPTSARVLVPAAVAAGLLLTGSVISVTLAWKDRS